MTNDNLLHMGGFEKPMTPRHDTDTGPRIQSENTFQLQIRSVCPLLGAICVHTVHREGLLDITLVHRIYS